MVRLAIRASDRVAQVSRTVRNIREGAALFELCTTPIGPLPNVCGYTLHYRQPVVLSHPTPKHLRELHEHIFQTTSVPSVSCVQVEGDVELALA
jgi:hypothetical protein